MKAQPRKRSRLTPRDFQTLRDFADTSVSVSKGLNALARNIPINAVMRTKRAVAFAEQLSEIEAYRPEMRFSDAVKGLHLYGAKVIYPTELVTFVFSY